MGGGVFHEEWGAFNTAIARTAGKIINLPAQLGGTGGRLGFGGKQHSR